MKHVNSGACEKCQAIFETYPGFNAQLRSWFTAFQKENPETHISCAGRGHIEQERDFQKGASKAHYGQSAHNYNCAIDLFVMFPGSSDIYPRDWFFNVLAPVIYKETWIDWGWSWSRFPEMPHLELANWQDLAERGDIQLVEGKVG